jgi:hypothetical protein
MTSHLTSQFKRFQRDIPEVEIQIEGAIKRRPQIKTLSRAVLMLFEPGGAGM